MASLWWCGVASHPHCKDPKLPMLDIIYIFIGLAVFGVFAGYVAGLRGI